MVPVPPGLHREMSTVELSTEQVVRWPGTWLLAVVRVGGRWCGHTVAQVPVCPGHWPPVEQCQHTCLSLRGHASVTLTTHSTHD